jgi:hypothetical protein
MGSWLLQALGPRLLIFQQLSVGRVPVQLGEVGSSRSAGTAWFVTAFASCPLCEVLVTAWKYWGLQCSGGTPVCKPGERRSCPHGSDPG